MQALMLPRGRKLDWSRAPIIMGILNITPDSFSDGGVHFDQSKAVHAALKMEDDGAAIIDIGGESTRPGALAVPADVEKERVLPVIEEIRRRSDIPISIDTMKAEVAEAALAQGADIINDVGALRRDPRMRAVAAHSGAPVILMHLRGEPRTMQETIHFDDVVGEVAGELRQFRDEAVSAGVAADRIFVDPGIGFGKTLDHNLALLANVERIAAETGRPVVIGASRKRFIQAIDERAKDAGVDRLGGSIAAALLAAQRGAAIVRVHDVAETVQALKVWRAVGA